MAELFGRQWALTVADRQWTDLRVVFEVQRRLNKAPDPAQITVYNLAPQNRTSFDAGDPVRLVAGYRDASGLLYSGTLVDVSGQRDGPDFATTFICRDGDAAWRAFVRMSFAGSASAQTVVKSIVSGMGLTLADGVQTVLAGKQTRASLAVCGFAHDALDRVLAPLGLRWCLQDGAVVVLPIDGATSENAVLLTPESGLIGSPEPMTSGKKLKGKKVTRLRITSLLQPSLMPGRRVVLQSTQYAGAYRVDRVQHRGDSHGQDWYSEAEVVAL